MSAERINELVSLLSVERVLTAASDLAHYGRDWTRWWPPAPLAVALPESIAEVQALVRWASERKVAIVPSGGRTGLSGGAVAAHGELVVSFERMHRIGEFDPLDRTLTVEAGVVTETVQKTARERGLYYPVDFGSRGSSQIGGNIATNAGGIKVIRYGMTREWVAGLKVVDGRGELLDLNRGLVKNATGYDLRHLMIGSEGTLGLVVEATLRLTDAPRNLQVMLLAVPDMAAVMRLLELARGRLALMAFEFFTDRAMNHVLAEDGQSPFETRAACYALVEYEGIEDHESAAMAVFETGMENGWLSDGVMAQSEAQAQALWHLREGITESVARYTPYKNDVSVRVSRVPAFLADMDALFAREYPDIEVIWFGHVGDGNLHISVLKPEGMDKLVFEHACERVTGMLCDVLEKHGGSISAEHGVGLLKKPYLARVRSAAEIELMRQVKRVFDPHGILNPGKLLE
ncbi:MAG TPA: FAD-binding oxidoreductase [Rhodanobacteraceae bacterium]|nr:FAD-binding oxidoreductase [Rhodanobacteraceae bacterium]